MGSQRNLRLDSDYNKNLGFSRGTSNLSGIPDFREKIPETLAQGILRSPIEIPRRTSLFKIFSNFFFLQKFFFQQFLRKFFPNKIATKNFFLLDSLPFFYEYQTFYEDFFNQKINLNIFKSYRGLSKNTLLHKRSKCEKYF